VTVVTAVWSDGVELVVTARARAAQPTAAAP